MSTAITPSDGRIARGERTRDAVVEAMLSLIDEGVLRPTARQVSERAGVSLRSVFQHFADLESLFFAASEHQVERMMPLAAHINSDASYAERLAAFVEARCQLLEALTPVRRAALLQEPFSTEIAARLRWAREMNREETERVFATELAALPAQDRRDVATALHAATEWTTWETLRAHDQLSEEDARRVMTRMIEALIKMEGTR